MLERFGIGAAAGAGGVRVLEPPGGVGGQVAFMGAHLVKAPCDELVQVHKGVGIQTAGVRIVVRGGVEEVPLIQQEEPGANL